jgi:hypothetical protein
VGYPFNMLRYALAASVLFSIVPLAISACGSDVPAGGFDDPNSVDGGGGPGFGFVDGGGSDVKSCSNLECQQVACGGGTTTSLTGTVYAPNGTLPVYNAIVYVPNSKPQAFTKGATCDKCGSVASGSPVVITLTDSAGKFKLDNVPVGKDIPVVIQLGKWRRQIVIPAVDKCVENKLTDSNVTRLPRTQSEGDIPKIAVTWGGCDQLGCMLPKLGLAQSEFGFESDGDSKAVHIYAGATYPGGPQPPPGAGPARNLWSDLNKLKNYDLSVLSCECSESPGTKDMLSYKAVTDYLGAGGRIFTTDFQYTWFKYSPDPALNSVSNITGGAPVSSNPFFLNDTFPKGKALADWLKLNFPSSTYGAVMPSYVFDNFANPVDPAKAQIWGTANPGGTSGNARVFTVNTPVGVKEDQQCGKAVHIDAHVNDGRGGTADNFPNACNSPLGQAEAMFAFFFLDLSSCVQKDNKPPVVPPR